MIKTILKVAGIILAVLVLAVIGLVVYILVNNYRYEEAKKKVNRLARFESELDSN